jgi:hypothetical protein
MLPSTPFRGLSPEGSPRKASKEEMDVNHHHSATQRNRLLVRRLVHGLRRAGEMNISNELLRPVIREDS